MAFGDTGQCWAWTQRPGKTFPALKIPCSPCQTDKPVPSVPHHWWHWIVHPGCPLLTCKQQLLCPTGNHHSKSGEKNNKERHNNLGNSRISPSGSDTGFHRQEILLSHQHPAAHSFPCDGFYPILLLPEEFRSLFLTWIILNHCPPWEFQLWHHWEESEIFIIWISLDLKNKKPCTGSGWCFFPLLLFSQNPNHHVFLPVSSTAP